MGVRSESDGNAAEAAGALPKGRLAFRRRALWLGASHELLEEYGYSGQAVPVRPIHLEWIQKGSSQLRSRHRSKYRSLDTACARRNQCRASGMECEGRRAE